MEEPGYDQRGIGGDPPGGADTRDPAFTPYQSDRVVENPPIFPPDENPNFTIGDSPEEQAALKEEQST